MTTTYGTISTATQERQWIRSGIGTRRPWKQFINFSSISIPESFNATGERVRTNASYFHVNYAIIVLFTLFISLLWHPVSLIVFTVTIFAWLFLYFLRKEPVLLFGYGVEERLVLAVLSIFTVVLLLLTRAMVFLVGLAAGISVVVVHAVFRRTNDLVFHDEEGGGSSVVVNLKDTASASYSLS